jgi:hypothetical protein
VSRNEDFDNAFWSQSVIEDLSAQATLFYIWSWTNPRCGMAGLYEVGMKAMTESKVPLADLDRVLTELADARLAVYLEDVLWIIARVKRLRTKSVQMAKSIAKDVAAIDVAHPLRLRWLEHQRGATWLKGALAERQVSLTGNLSAASREPHQISDAEPNIVSLTRTSPEVPLSGEGKAVTDTTSVNSQITRAQIDEACTILAARWEDPDEVAVENCVGMYPTVDLGQACRLAVTWASDPSWEIQSCAATLRAAMRKLDAEKPKQDVTTARRGRRRAALESLMASTEPVA